MKGLLLIVLVAGCKGATPVAEAASVPKLKDGIIWYPQSFADRERITLEPASEALLTPQISVTGRVAWNARRVSAIGARIEGRVRELLKVEGDTVKEQEVVVKLESVELGKAQAEVQKARAHEQVAKIDAERDRKLADAKISPERDAQFSAANAEALSAERRAAETALEALGGTVDGEVGIVRLRSPISGTVVQAKARRGETVHPTDTLLVVADTSQVWIELEVFERDLAAVSKGDKVDIALGSSHTTEYHGEISHVGQMIDDQTRSAIVRVELENKDGRLRPGLSMTASIHASGPQTSKLSIPVEAVTRIDGQPTVFVSVGENSVEARRITIGADDGKRVAVNSGLKLGEKVVVHGVLSLKAEVFR